MIWILDAVKPLDMSQFWLDFLTKQIPVIVVMGLGLWWMGKYFMGVIDKKDIIIAAKESEIRELNKDLLDVSIKIQDAMSNVTVALRDLKDVVKLMK